MAKKKVELRKVFLPSDSIAFIAIGVGLVIAVVAPGDNLAVRLIGICIAILGGVALFMMVSPRLTGAAIRNAGYYLANNAGRQEAHADVRSRGVS
jgi:hypothetical protein